MHLTDAQRCLLGLDESHLESREDGVLLRAETARAFEKLRLAASESGFDLRIASAFRSFERQCAIWNGKYIGERSVLDDTDCKVDVAAMDFESRCEAILRFSALPGVSRHHWGTDIDVYDAAAVDSSYALQLSLAEVADNGPFAPLHRWLDERIALGTSFGFYRPYDRDRGGVSPERWHLSYAPIANALQSELTPELLGAAWDAESVTSVAEKAALKERLESLLERYHHRVAQPADAVRYYSGVD